MDPSRSDYRVMGLLCPLTHPPRLQINVQNDLRRPNSLPLVSFLCALIFALLKNVSVRFDACVSKFQLPISSRELSPTPRKSRRYYSSTHSVSTSFALQLAGKPILCRQLCMFVGLSFVSAILAGSVVRLRTFPTLSISPFCVEVSVSVSPHSNSSTPPYILLFFVYSCCLLTI